MELHYKCMEHARANQTKPKQSHDMAKHHQKHAEMERKQARMTCYFMKHIKLVCVIYTTSVSTMNGVAKASKNSVMPQQKKKNPNTS